MNETCNSTGGLKYTMLKNIMLKQDKKRYILCNSIHMKAKLEKHLIYGEWESVN